CACANCRHARAGDGRVQPRTQDSLALSADDERWVLLNCSPDVRAQIASFPSLWPPAARSTPIEGCLLTDGDLDHCLGLFALRESTPLVVCATARVREGLERNVLVRTLARTPDHLTWQRLTPGAPLELCARSGAKLGLSVLPFAVPGKVPIHLHGIL